MSIPTSKQELRAAIELNYKKLKKEIIAIPLAQSTIPNLVGHAKGTSMSINQLISYLVGWGELTLKWIEKKDHQERVDFPETGYKWNELGRLAQKFYKDYEGRGFNDLCEKLDLTVTQILHIVEQKSNAELYEVAWYEKWTLGRMIQLNTSSPYINARSRIVKWRKIIAQSTEQ